jgi:hypothetical protein
MDFKIGYNVKPKEITDLGVVIFEEYQLVSGRYELVEVSPTADECKAYNFEWTGVKCFIIADDNTLKVDKVIKGTRDTIGNNTYNSIIAGVDNTLEYANNNNLIVGDNNKISSNISNTILSGTKGLANYSNSQVLGGNNDTDILGERQAVQVMAAAATTNNVATTSYLNNDGATMIKVADDSIINFSADVVAVRTGGTGAGDKGDFKAFNERGVVVNIGGTLTIERTRIIQESNGTTSGWLVEAKTTGEYLYLEVVGKNNRDIKWAVKWNLIEIKTGVDLSA